MAAGRCAPPAISRWYSTISRPATKTSSAVRWSRGDLLDRAALASAFAQYDIVAVMHFAAASLVGESVVDPRKYYQNNVVGTLSLLDAMRAAGCNRLVFSSTGAVYGNADSKALPESYPCVPINPYGASKWMIERLLADYRSAYGLGAFCLRYFNASGRRSGRAASANCATPKRISFPAP